MDYDERESKAISIGEVHIKQLEEQSEFCDFTVRVGQWEKRFHRSVLAASPFFEKMFKHEFKEKQKAFVDLSIGTAETVEMSLMFLYGKQPTITMGNAGTLIELSDFFLIPTMKAAVMNWLKDIEISPDICFELLKICTLYDADLPNLITYVESHLKELILRPEMTWLTEESVRYVLSATIFSYVPVDDKIRFILLWIKQDIHKRKRIINELFGIVDQTEISKALFNEIKDDLLTLNFSDMQGLKTRVDENIKDRTVIVMMPSFTCVHPFFCYDALQKKWYRLESTAFTNLQTRNMCMCEVCKIVPGYTSGAKYCVLTHDEKVHFLDIAADTCEECELIINQEYCTIISPFSNFTIGGDIYYAHVDGIHLTDAKDYNACSDRFPFTVHNPFSYGTAENVYIPTRHSTAYGGKVKDGKIEMAPMFTLKNSTITHLCANQFIITVIIDQVICLVFDLDDHTLEKINVSIDSEVNLHASRDGAILLNSHRCILILRSHGSLSCPKYTVREISFANSDASYKFFNGYFIRCFRKDLYADFQMEIARYDNMKCADSIVDVIWEPCLLPPTDCISDVPDHQFIEMSFPRDKLRCDIDCPHCKRVLGASRKFKMFRLKNIDEMFNNEERSDDGSYLYENEGSNDVTDTSDDDAYLDDNGSLNDYSD